MSITCRPLTHQDYRHTIHLDNLSGNELAQWITHPEDDDLEYAHGIFLDDNLIGYCSVGCADVLDDELREFNIRTYEDVIISDIYIHKKHRKQGFGYQLIQYIINTHKKHHEIYLVPMYDELKYFYQPLGFEFISPDTELSLIMKYNKKGINI